MRNQCLLKPQAVQVRGAALLEEFYIISKGAWLRTLQFMNESQKEKEEEEKPNTPKIIQTHDLKVFWLVTKASFQDQRNNLSEEDN